MKSVQNHTFRRDPTQCFALWFTLCYYRQKNEPLNEAEPTESALCCEKNDKKKTRER